MFSQISSTAAAMCLAALALGILGLVSARDEIASSRGLDRILALDQSLNRRAIGGIQRPPPCRPSIRQRRRAAIHAMAHVLGLFRGRRLDVDGSERRRPDRGAAVGASVRPHDVSIRRHDSPSRRDLPPSQPNRQDDRLPGDVVRRRRLDSRGTGDVRAGRPTGEDADRRGSRIRHHRDGGLRSRALLSSDRTSRRPARKADAGVGARGCFDRLFDRNAPLDRCRIRSC